MTTDRDILGKHDALMLDLIAAEFGDKLPGQTVQVLWASPKKYFMEYVTRQNINTRPEVPRIAVQRLDTIHRPEMHNFNPIRKIACDDRGNWMHSNYPTPIDIQYQVDFWTLRQSEMNYWERHAHLLFWGPGANHYEKVTVGAPWYDKYVRFESDTMQDNSDIEPPTEEDRLVRKTLTVSMKTYTYPELLSSPFGVFDAPFFQTIPTVRRISVAICDFSGAELWSFRNFSLPPNA